MSESLARALGDIDRLVRELARDLGRPARYVRIAHELDVGAPQEDALDWLQQGVTAHGAADEGCATRSSRPTCAPTAVRTRSHCCATSCSGHRAPRSPPSCSVPPERNGTRERAWAHAQLAQAAERDGDAGELVTALLADGATAAALGAAEEALRPVAVRLELARIAAVDDLDAALKHYRLLVAAELETSERESYGNAVRHLRAMRKAADAHGRGAEVIAFAHAAREEHTRRRTLVTMLDKLGWW